MTEAEIFHIDEKSGIPIWMQIRRRLIFLIASGHYACGERLPSVRELSVQWGVNYNTINKVYQDLERDGYIFTKRGKGTYVSETIESLPQPIDDEVAALAAQLVETARKKGMEIDEIIALVHDEHGRISRAAH